LWASTLFDELLELGYDRSYPTMTRALRARGLRPACEPCAPTKGRAVAVIEHPPGEETQWDWVELPEPPAHWGWGKDAHLLVGSLSHSGRLAGSPIAPPTGGWWTPRRDRLSRHGELLDRTLEEFGLSPHTRVTLIVEGESEAQTVTRVMNHLGISARGEEIRVVNMRGISSAAAIEAAPERRHRVSRVQFLATHLVTPVIVEATPDYYVTLRPIAQVRIAADPEGEFTDPAAFKAKVLAMVQQNLADQDATDVDPDSPDQLLDVVTWEHEFEFAHFTDDELFTALATLNDTFDGRAPEHGRERLARCRAGRNNIRYVWDGWTPKPSKTKLAEALWPALRRRIDLAIRDSVDAPPMVAVVHQAHQEAIQGRRTHFVLPRSRR
jgi:hypothetical protein